LKTENIIILDCDLDDTKNAISSFYISRDHDEFNRNAFKGELETAVVQWSKKLNTTAGITRLQNFSSI